MQAHPHGADIAQIIPPGVIPEIDKTLEKTSRVLGMFEAYDVISRQSGALESMLESDEITLAVLEDLHERAARVLNDAGQIADSAHSKGFANILRMACNGQAPDLSQLREEARSVIAEGWNLEEDIPAFGYVPLVDIDDPFEEAPPTQDIDEIGF